MKDKSINETFYIEQYKLYVEMADRVSARRIEASKFYTSLVSAFFAVIPILLTQNVSPYVQNLSLFIISLLGIALCIVWSINLRSYKQLNGLKFEVINEMEGHLPFRCFEQEWKLISNPDNNRNYTRLSQVEMFVPFLFSIFFVGIIISTFAIEG